MESIQPGSRTQVVDAFGRVREKVALSDVRDGREFPIIWLCEPSEWEAAQAEGREPRADPLAWPASSLV